MPFPQQFSTPLLACAFALGVAASSMGGGARVVAAPIPAAIGTSSAAEDPASSEAETEPSEGGAALRESDFVTRVRRLTYEGKRAGEGYFSPDGSKLVFQSEREPANPFYQIYELDLSSGETRRVSPGSGKTTCSFVRSGSGEILFASTHHDPRSLELQREELELRASGRERRYAWDYDPEMELWVADPKTLALRRLTETRGYDAEASYSPDGKWIVFSSTRSGYQASPGGADDAERAKQLETDPSYFGEIYLMPAEGGEPRRLTAVPGYDGGPFFFHDGSRIVWRRFDENGLIADVWTMKPDGSDQRRITDFGAMSWAPWADPTGSYILFASNKLGFSNFEIFMVDALGNKEPVRVTYTDGFDGLPVLSPDGRTLAWTSTRHGEPGGQIFVGVWNHETALAAIAAAPPRVATPVDAVAALRAEVERLAAPELGGRLTGTDGERLAAELLAAELRAIGARPLPGEDDLLVPFEFTAGAHDAGSSLRLEGEAPVEWQATSGDARQVQALSFSDQGKVAAEVVFAGYGIKVPDGKDLSYDSYFGLDLAGKIALVLRYSPEDTDEELRTALSRYSGLRYKAMHAREAGAVGIIIVTGPRSPNAGELVPMTFDTAISGSGIVAASVAGDVAQRLFAAAGRELAEAQAALDTGNPHVAGFALPGVRVTLDVAIERERRLGHNVVGVLPRRSGAPEVDRPWLLIGAHYDHLGEGGHGNSLARKGEVGQIHRGADDNASGVAAVLATAARLATAPADRGVVVALWSGEELGLLGSTDFVRRPVLAPEQLEACLGFDMVGRSHDNKLVVQGVGSSGAWRSLVEQANVPVGFDLQLQDDPQLPTDTASFDRVGVPCLNFFTGGHQDYHRPTDTPEKLNYEGLERVVDLAANIGRRLLTLEPPIQFTKVEPKIVRGPAGDGVRAFTGTIPDYTAEVEGLKLAGVIEGGPADQAGLAEGDVLVEFGGRAITNIYDYTYALEAVKIGVPLEVVYLRGGERREATVTPRARP